MGYRLWELYELNSGSLIYQTLKRLMNQATTFLPIFLHFSYLQRLTSHALRFTSIAQLTLKRVQAVKQKNSARSL